MKEKQDELVAVEEACAKLEWKSNLAGRLVNGLKDEYKWWKGLVEELNDLMRKIVIVNLISSGFVSYCGPYDLKFDELMILEQEIQIGDKIMQINEQ